MNQEFIPIDWTDKIDRCALLPALTLFHQNRGIDAEDSQHASSQQPVIMPEPQVSFACLSHAEDAIHSGAARCICKYSFFFLAEILCHASARQADTVAIVHWNSILIICVWTDHQACLFPFMADNWLRKFNILSLIFGHIICLKLIFS